VTIFLSFMDEIAEATRRLDAIETAAKRNDPQRSCSGLLLAGNRSKRQLRRGLSLVIFLVKEMNGVVAQALSLKKSTLPPVLRPRHAAVTVVRPYHQQHASAQAHELHL
jgi:hypothetical protein